MSGKLLPLAMSQRKEELMTHLNLAPTTYSMMAKETDDVYKWLTQDKRHLKHNGKQQPPYDWSDINEKAKDEAMIHLSRSGNAHTSYYWNLAAPGDCPNWIARWFLYHKFRYRDGRNKNSAKTDGDQSSHWPMGTNNTSQPYPEAQMSHHTSNYTAYGSPSGTYGTSGTSTQGYMQGGESYLQCPPGSSKDYYDPVRDV
ncbi:uncharacterized protein BP5553_01115 [Venustampulla echinocandica]|uniref:Uncharacterized protein n=1 Tax=Venustampulla echinocandica TaxID=2656787 RepID=A0A370U031_9HELO|nr:uncharacterized protein BP5553_01115 [Venustampulla echinocandica]RDL41136.1 hypothetical protein BP5553_01115 [Venustampulla echinocandica]